MIKVTLQYISAAQSEAGIYPFSLGGILNDHHVASLMYIHCLVTAYLSCTSHEREGEEEGAEGEEEGEVGGEEEEKEGKRGRGRGRRGGKEGRGREGGKEGRWEVKRKKGRWEGKRKRRRERGEGGVASFPGPIRKIGKGSW